MRKRNETLHGNDFKKALTVAVQNDQARYHQDRVPVELRR